MRNTLVQSQTLMKINVAIKEQTAKLSISLNMTKSLTYNKIHKNVNAHYHSPTITTHNHDYHCFNQTRKEFL